MTLPIVLPTIIAVGVLTFAVSMDEFVVTNFIIGGDQTLPVLVWGLFQRQGISPVVNAIATMLSRAQRSRSPPSSRSPVCARPALPETSSAGHEPGSCTSGRVLAPSFPTPPWEEEACLEWLWHVRFRTDDGRVYCVRCERHQRHHRARARRSWACQGCGNHVHPTAGTLFHRSRTPLVLWFRTIELVDATHGDLSIRQLARELGVTYKTAWRMAHAVRDALPDSSDLADHPPSERLEVLCTRLVSDAYTPAGRVEPCEFDRRRVRAQALRSSLGDGQTSLRNDAVQRILVGACRAMARRGLAGTRVDDIAAEAQVSVPTIYRYFETKQDALLAAVDWSDWDGTQRREEIVSGEHDPVTKLALFLDFIVPDTQSIEEVYALYLDVWARAARDQTLRPMVERAEDRWHAYFRRILIEGVGAQVFTLHRDLEDVIEYLVALSVGLAMPSTVGCRSMPNSRLRRLLFSYATAELDLPPGLLEKRVRRAAARPAGGPV